MSPEGAGPPGTHATAGARGGRVALTLAPDAEGHTFLSRQFAAYPFHLCRPHRYDGDPSGMTTICLQTLSGGLYEGDRLSLDLTLEAGAKAHVTTQAATVARGMERDEALVETLVTCGPESLLELLPEATILFPGARLTTRTRIEADPSATVLLGESFLGHDPAGGTRPFGRYDSSLAFARPGAAPLVRDRYSLSGETFRAGAPGIVGVYPTQGTLYAFHPPRDDARSLEALRAALDGLDGVYAGASALPRGAGTWARILAADGADLRRAMSEAWAALRETLTGRRPEPRRK